VQPNILKNNLITRLAEIEYSARKILVIEGKRRFESFTAGKLDSNIGKTNSISTVA
jgi:hypothetical protein